jgi:hypothetical protein
LCFEVRFKYLKILDSCILIANFILRFLIRINIIMIGVILDFWVGIFTNCKKY